METSHTPVAILVRVSTLRQETDRQVSELTAYAERMGYEVVEICQEWVSGRAEESERSGLARVLQLAEAGKIKRVLVSEVSRIARRSSVVHRFVEELERRGVSLFWLNGGLETLSANGSRNPAAFVVLALLAEIARGEVEQLRERVLSGLAEARRKGVRLGRPIGSTVSTEQLLEKHADIVRLLRKGQSIRNASKISGRGISTVQRVRLALAE